MKTILTLLSLSICLTVSAQTHKAKPAIADTTKKQQKVYTLFIPVDSAGYVQITQALARLSQDIDGSNIPHDKEKIDQSFIQAIYTMWSEQKKAQDKKTDKK